MTWRKMIGFLLLLISCIAWAALPIIPFLPYKTSVLAAWVGAVFIFAEVTWWLAIPFLGKDMIQWGKVLLAKAKELLKDEPKK